MPEDIVPPVERVGKKVTDRIDELERVVKALLKGMQDAESVTEEPLMPIGNYYGTEFAE